MNTSEILFGLFLSFDLTELSYPSLFRLMNPFSVSETTLRATLSRLSDRSLINIRREGKRAFYSLSPKAVKQASNTAAGFRDLSWDKWDGRFTGTAFSIPEEKNDMRHKIRIKLEFNRYGCWYPGLWIRPHHPLYPHHDFLEELRSIRGCSVLTLYPEPQLTQSEAAAIWNLESLPARMAQARRKLQSEIPAAETLSTDESLRNLIITGGHIVSLFAEDPLLPPSLYPEEWPGGELKYLFKEWVTKHHERLKPVIEKIEKEKE